MLDAGQIISLTRKGQIPLGWRAFYGRKPSPLLAGCVTLLLTLFLFSLIGVGVLLITNYFQSWEQFWQRVQQAPLELFINRNGSVTPISIGSLAILVGACLLAIIIASAKAAQTHGGDPLLVLLPEGFVEHVNMRKVPFMVHFSHLEAMSLNCVKRDTAQLHLHYLHGRSQYWSPAGNFRDEEGIVQRILEAHALYKGSVSR